PARRSSSRRSYRPRRAETSSVSAICPLLSLAECSAGEPRDETVETRVVEERERDARDERGDHDRSPLRQVAANEVGVHPGRQRPVVGARDEGERIDELVEHQREREDDNGENPRNRDRKNNAE